MFRSNTKITRFNEFVYFTRVAKLDNWAMNGASNLEAITFPNSLTSLGGNSLRKTKLRNITLPASIRAIGDYCIYGFSYQTLTVFATIPPTISFNTNSAPIGNIYVPSSAVDTYKSASGWSSWAAKIVAIQE